MRAGYILAALPLVALGFVALAYALCQAFAEAPAKAAYYPCSKCHGTVYNVTGDVKVSRIHGINLTAGAHAGLYCSSCHVPVDMMKLVGGVPLKLAGVHPREEVMEVAKSCAVCHSRAYEDWVKLAHGGATYVCRGGNVTVYAGYKGVPYPFHECPSYRGVVATNARACTECHDPHDPVMRPVKPLPPPSTRPPAPEQGSVAAATAAVAFACAGMLVAAGATGRRGGK